MLFVLFKLKRSCSGSIVSIWDTIAPSVLCTSNVSSKFSFSFKMYCHRRSAWISLICFSLLEHRVHGIRGVTLGLRDVFDEWETNNRRSRKLGHKSDIPSSSPSNSLRPSSSPAPSFLPSAIASASPSEYPSLVPSVNPTMKPTQMPSDLPSNIPTNMPSQGNSLSSYRCVSFFHFLKSHIVNCCRTIRSAFSRSD